MLFILGGVPHPGRSKKGDIPLFSTIIQGVVAADG